MLEPHNNQEAAEWMEALNDAERAAFDLLRDGWTLISDQYSRKTWLQCDDKTQKLSRKVREYSQWEINLWNLLEVQREDKFKTVDGRGHTRIYIRVEYRINRYAK